MKSSSNLPSDDVLGRPQDVFLRWSGRINRLRLLGAHVVLTVSTTLIGGVVMAPLLLVAQSWPDVRSEIMTGGVILIGALVIAAMFFMSAPITQRAHDVGWSGVVPAVLAAVTALFWPLDIAMTLYGVHLPPILDGVARALGGAVGLGFIAILVLPGEKAENRFGTPPAPL